MNKINSETKIIYLNLRNIVWRKERINCDFTELARNDHHVARVDIAAHTEFIDLIIKNSVNNDRKEK